MIVSYCDRLRTSAARYVADLHVTTLRVSKVLLKHIHTCPHTSLHAESNCLNTYKKQLCKKYNSLNEKYTGKPNSKYKIFNSKAWPKWHVRWVQKWRKLNCWSTMWALTYYKHEKNMKRPSYSTKEVSMKTFVSAWKPLHPVSTKIQNITK